MLDDEATAQELSKELWGALDKANHNYIHGQRAPDRLVLRDQFWIAFNNVHAAMQGMLFSEKKGAVHDLSAQVPPRIVLEFRKRLLRLEEMVYGRAHYLQVAAACDPEQEGCKGGKKQEKNTME